MASVPYTLVCAVQDLYELYLRLSPVGPYRLELFHDRGPALQSWPEQAARRAGLLDQLIRGAGCLLANDLAPAALPVIASAWSEVRAVERELSAGGYAEPEYYRYLADELARVHTGTQPVAYRLLGEVLAVYLDVLCAAQVPGSDGLGVRVKSLRRVVVQTGENSSSSTFGTDKPPAGAVGG